MVFAEQYARHSLTDVAGKRLPIGVLAGEEQMLSSRVMHSDSASGSCVDGIKVGGTPVAAVGSVPKPRHVPMTDPSAREVQTPARCWQ